MRKEERDETSDDPISTTQIEEIDFLSSLRERVFGTCMGDRVTTGPGRSAE